MLSICHICPRTKLMPYISAKNNLTPKRSSYGHMFVTNMVMGNPTTCVYQFGVDNSNEHPVVTTKYFIMNVLVLCMN